MDEKTEIYKADILTRMERGFVINDRYEVNQRLGSGGFAVVFVGVDRQIEREVAIKVMNTGGAIDDEETRQQLVTRFQREAKLAARVDHPNVLNIFDYGIIDGENEPFIVMELLQGHDLEIHLQRQGGMRPFRAITLFIDTLVALGVAHEQGIVHKDLKPSNLFLKRPDTRFESLCILDFGIAHIEQQMRSRLTRAGQLMGTPAYLAPEYSSDSIVTPALDIYQMGLLLVEALVGEAVVTHPEPMSAMFQHVRGELEIPVALLECPLGPVLQRALAMDHTARYQNGLDFADALAEVPQGSVPRVDRSSPTVELSEFSTQTQSLHTAETLEEHKEVNPADHAQPEGAHSDLAYAETWEEHEEVDPDVHGAADSGPQGDVAHAETMAMMEAPDTEQMSAPEREEAESDKSTQFMHGTDDGADDPRSSAQIAGEAPRTPQGGIESSAERGTTGTEVQFQAPSPGQVSHRNTPSDERETLDNTEPPPQENTADTGDIGEKSVPPGSADEPSARVGSRFQVDTNEATGTMELMQPGASRTKVAVVAALFVTLLVATVVVAWTLTDLSEIVAGDAAPESVEEESLAADPGEKTDRDGEESVEAAGGAEPSEEEEDILIEIVADTEPSAAAVYEDGQQLGETPLFLEFDDEDAASRHLVMKLDEHEDKEVEVAPDDGPEISWTLEPVSAPAPEPEPQPRPEPQPDPEPTPEPEPASDSTSSPALPPPAAEEPSEEDETDDGGEVLLPDF